MEEEWPALRLPLRYVAIEENLWKFIDGVHLSYMQMKNPNDFKKSYALVQIGSVIVYVLVGCLIYVFGGQVSRYPINI